MTPRELQEWAIYARLEPIGGQRADYHAALIASTIANVNRGKSTPAFKLERFLLFDVKPEKPKGKKAAADALRSYLSAKKDPSAGQVKPRKRRKPDGS